MPPRLRVRCLVCGSLAFVEKLDQDHEFDALWQIFGGRGKINYYKAEPALREEMRRKLLEKIRDVIKRSPP